MRALFLAFICMILTSPAFARDIYFCNSLENLEINEGKLTKYNLQNFKMLVTQSSITITGDSYFNGANFDVSYWGSSTFWDASDDGAHISFQEPFFHFAFVTYDGITAISARCDKF